MRTSFTIRPVSKHDRDPLLHLIDRIAEFSAAEKSVAAELVSSAVQDPGGDYKVIIAHLQDRAAGYICYGRTPMTQGTYDLYWLATDPGARGNGIARRLVEAFEADAKREGGRLVRVETSSQGDYQAARDFYRALGYEETARLPEFYKPGDDLIVFTRRLA